MWRRALTLLIAQLVSIIGDSAWVLGKQNVKSYDNNFYVILSASKFFFNYRHSLNAIVFY